MNDSSSGASPVLLLEYWKPLIGFESNYGVSNTGNVCVAKSKLHLKQRVNDKGYLIVRLTREKYKRPWPVHRLVSETFIGKLPEGYHTNHKDAWKLRNWLSNLEYVTPQYNHLHATLLGLRSVKLTEKDVLAIRQLAKHYPTKEIAERFRVHKSNVAQILRRDIWKHVA